MWKKFIVIVSLIFFINLPNVCLGQTKQLTIRNFLGLSTKTSSSDLPPEYATIAENSRFDTIGSVSKRLNRSKYNSTSLGANPITHIDRIYIGSNKYLIIGYTTFLKVGNDAAGTFAVNLKTELTSGLKFQGVTYKNFHYLGNGTNANIRTDGTAANTTTMGCQIPGTAPTMAQGTTGTLPAGTYKGKVTFVYDGYQESNGNTTSATVTISKSVGATTFTDGGGGVPNLDDCTSGGTYTYTENLNYKVRIDSELGGVGGVDTFEWSDDGGTTWDATDVDITGAAQTLNNGVTVTFGATTGHDLDDYWVFTCLAKKQIAWSVIPTGASGTGVTKRKLYRSQLGTTSPLYLLTTIADNTTTTYTDDTIDADLGADTIPIDHDVPPTFKYIVEHKERLFMAPEDSSLLYYTPLEDTISYPDIAPATNYLPISEDDGDIITGLAIDPLGMLTVFKKNCIRKVFVEGPPTMWSISSPFAYYGCVAPYSIAESPQGIIYLSRAGDKKEIRIFDGQASKVISERVEPTLQQISNTKIEQSTGIYYEDKYYLSYVNSVLGTTYNNQVIIFDFKRDAYSTDIKNINCFSVWSGSDDWGQLYTGDSVSGFVYWEEAYSQDIIHRLKSELDTGTYDNCESSGTEQSPEIMLITADLTSAVGAQTWDDLSGAGNTWDDYNGEDDTWWPSGDLKSAILEVNAITLQKGFWEESLGSNGDITFQYRTGDSIAACGAASWSSKFTDPTGSNISGLTAADYIQYQARLYTNDISIVTTPKLYREDYVVKISCGLGTYAETSIPFTYQTGDLDLGTPFLTKRFRSLRTKADLEGDSYTIKYYLDGLEGGTFTITDNSQVDYFPLTAFGENLRLRVEENSDDNFSLNELTITAKEEPIRY